MKRFLLATNIISAVFFLSYKAQAQGSQTVVNGSQTTPITFPSGGCSYNWVNSTPGIGLAASGIGDIAAFTAVNNGSTPITATVTATPAESGFIFASNPYTNSVVVVNATTNAVVANIQVGGGPSALSVSPDGRRLYVVNTESASVSVINTATDQVIATIPVGPSPYGVVVSPDGKTVYVTNQASNSISVINAASNVVTSTIALSQYAPWGISISADGAKLVTADYGSNSISVINTSNQAVQSVGVGTTPIGIATSLKTGLVYVANFGSDNISVVNVQTNTVVATIPVGASPMGVTISPDGANVYVTNSGSNTVSVINTVANQVTSTIPVGQTPEGVSISADGSLVYVFNTNANTMSVISTASNSVSATSNVSNGQYSIGTFVAGCSPVKLTITVNPTSITPVITVGSTTGTISACQGSPSASPNIQRFTVSGSNLTNDVLATAPAGFEVSLSAGNGYGHTVNVPQSGGTANNTIVYVRSAASATGSISGDVTLTSQGANAQNVAVSGKVNPLPTVNNPGNQTVNAGSNTTAINFTGTAGTFNWVNNNPAIGLPPGGTGDIPAFTAANNGSSPITATLTVTPVPSVNAYICNGASNTVTVLNTANNTIISTITVGSGPIGVAISPDGSKAYVTNAGSATVSVINTITNTVTSTIPVGQYPYGICVSPDGGRIYVTCYSSNYVAIINAATNAVIATIDLPYTNGIAISPDGSKLYVTNEASGLLTVINTATYAIITKIIVGTYPFAVITSPDGSRVYVTDYVQNMAVIIDAATNSVIAKVPVGNNPTGITINPDGSKVYVANAASNTTSVINTVTNAVIASVPVGSKSIGLSVTGDGRLVYVTNPNSQTVSVINAQTNTVTATIPLTLNPGSFGNFISSGISCSGTPVTFTITVNPLSISPVITAGTVTGTIAACQGSASVSPAIQQFTVSGTALTNDITATTPTGFELSLSAIGGYGASVTIPQSAGAVNNVTIYVRSAASAMGNISGAVTLTSMGAADKTVTVTGKVNALPTVSNIPDQKIVNGTLFKGIIFNGTGADTYLWVNDNPSIGIGSGTSPEIVPFTATNTSEVPVIGTFTVTPINTTTGCSGAPITFTIEVDPILPAVITATGTLSSLSTIYGTASASTSFSVSGTNMNAGISVTPPAGFEVSTDNTNFRPTETIGTSGTINATRIYVRLTSQTPVGSYSGNIVLSSSGATSAVVSIPVSVVNPAVLTITANNVQKSYGQTLTSGTVSTGFTANGLQNNETIGNVFIAYNSGAGPSDKAGTYAGSVVPSDVSGGSFNPKNYTITYQSGDIIVIDGLPNQPIAIPNAFTPNGDGINDVWNVKSLTDCPSCLVSIFTRYGSMVYQSRGYAKPWDGVYNGNPLPVGTYYYIIDLHNGQPPFSGWVALIR